MSFAEIVTIPETEVSDSGHDSSAAVLALLEVWQNYPGFFRVSHEIISQSWTGYQGGLDADDYDLLVKFAAASSPRLKFDVCSTN